MKLIDEKILLFDLPFKTDTFGTIYQPKIKDFLDFDYARFKAVFSIRKDLYIDDKHEDYDNIKDFDMIIVLGLLEDFKKSLQILYKTDCVKIDIKQKTIQSTRVIVKANEEIYVFDRNNYNKFADIILILLHDGNNIADEKEKEELSEIELMMKKRRQEFERKKAKREAEIRKNNEEKNIMTIFDIANYIIHNDNKYNYESVLNLTIYQLINSYTLYMQKENYGYFMDYKTSGNFNIEQNISHWFFGE